MGQPLPISSPPPAPPASRGARWLPLGEVARRLGVGERQAANRCQLEWFQSGHARKQQPAGGGRECWHVRSDAHALLGRSVFSDALKVDLSPLNGRQRKLFNYRCLLFDSWRGFLASRVGTVRDTREDATRLFLLSAAANPVLTPPKGERLPTFSTLRAWESKLREMGYQALVDERWLRKADTKDGRQHPFFAEFVRVRLTQQGRQSRVCYQRTAAMFEGRPEQILSYKKCLRLFEKVPVEVKVKHCEGDTAFTNKIAGYVRRDYSTLHSNEEWQSDHHRFDFHVTHQGKTVRPWLTAWMDSRSRMIVGWRVYVGNPNSSWILLALRNGVMKHGRPESVYIDNGKDFQSRAMEGATKKERRREADGEEIQRFAGVFPRLGTIVRHCQPYHPQSKAIERLFGTVCEEFSKWIASYCGNSPTTRPENLPDKLARGAAPAIEDVRERFAEFVRYYNEKRPHTGDSMNGRTPAGVYRECDAGEVSIPTERLDELTLKASPLVSVGQHGVRLKGIDFNGPALYQLFNEKVAIHYDPEDVSIVRIYSADGTFKCTATPVQRVPYRTSENRLEEAMKLVHRSRRQAGQWIPGGPRIASNAVDALWQLQTAEASQPQAAAMKLPVGDQFPEAAKARRAIERRQVVASPRAREPGWLIDQLGLVTASDRPAVRSPSFAELMAPGMKRMEEERAAEDKAAAEENADMFSKLQRAFRKAE